MRSINDYIPTLIQIIVLVYVLFRLFQTMVRAGRRVPLVFFTFAMAGLLLTDLYWMTFDILYPTTRMPFAANEICECALFLSLASTLAAMTVTLGIPAKWETLFTLVFIAANTALWIAWSGEWVQDIITGLVLGYLSIRLVKHMKQTGALPSAVWKILGIIFVLVIMAHIATFLVPEQFKDGCDLTAYLLMLGVVVYFVVRAVKSLTKGTDPQAAISLSFASCTLSNLFLYMSAGLFYNIANCCSTLAILLMFISVRKEALS
jgi:hypothetical protein